MPKKSILVSFGNLSGDKLKIDNRDIMFDEKEIIGFFAPNYLKHKSLYWRYCTSSFIVKEANDTLYTLKSKEFNIQEYREAIEYYKNHMSEGKIIFKLWD